MPAARMDLSIEAGSNWERDLIFSVSSVKTDLTGMTFRGQIRKTASDATVLASFTFTIADQTQLATRGTVKVALPAEVSSALPVAKQSGPLRTPAVFAYDIERVQSNGKPDRIFEGLVNVSPEVTRV